MAARARVQLKLPEKALRKMLERFGDDVLPVIHQKAKDAGVDAMQKMVELAPFKEGELESSAIREVVSTPRGRRTTTTFKFLTPYAGIVHEMGQDSRGPGTVSKAGNEFGQAGPKYIERVLRGFKLGEKMGVALRDFWRAARGV